MNRYLYIVQNHKTNIVNKMSEINRVYKQDSDHLIDLQRQKLSQDLKRVATKLTTKEKFKVMVSKVSKAKLF